MTRLDSILTLTGSGFRRMAYRDWPGQGVPVLCLHGLTRNGADFDALAARLSATGRRVACPDALGRGRSDRLASPAEYAPPRYLADMTALIARLGGDAVDWIGTSMGGIVGMLAAAQPGSPVRALVLNDVGPFIPAAALRRIGDYVGRDPVFADMAALEAHLREVHAPFGALTDPQWRKLAEDSADRRPDGTLGLAYDPAIGQAFAGPIADVDLWPVWDAIRCPVLVLRGESSDLLTADTAAAMARRGGGRVRVETIPGCGHAPALLDEAQTGLIAAWLAAL
jgi:pimeloyl-ACP methyl ester carboxylesterase